PSTEPRRKRDMAPQHVPKALRTVTPKDKPELERAEAPPELNPPVAEIDHVRIMGGAEIFGRRAERAEERVRVPDEVRRAVKIGEQPLVRIEHERLGVLHAIEDPAALGEDRRGTGIG